MSNIKLKQPFGSAFRQTNPASASCRETTNPSLAASSKWHSLAAGCYGFKAIGSLQRATLMLETGGTWQVLIVR
jgi:hypothetical protein